MELNEILKVEEELSSIIKPTHLIRSNIVDNCQLYL